VKSHVAGKGVCVQHGRGGKGVEGERSPPRCADAQPWAEVRALAHETWFVECALDAAMARVAARQVRPGSGVLHPPRAHPDRPWAHRLMPQVLPPWPNISLRLPRVHSLAKSSRSDMVH